MSNDEIKRELLMSYEELVNYLLDKYGPAKYDYFRNESCRSRNPKVSRTNEGLVCHHIDEDKAILLSSSEEAVYQPFDYQKADRLVYCNILEHLLLHKKILFKPLHPEADPFEPLGVGGILKICEEVNAYFSGYKFKRESDKKILDVVADNLLAYTTILNLIIKETKEKRPEYAGVLTAENLSCRFDGKLVEEVYQLLD